jgi:hypothetical protein
LDLAAGTVSRSLPPGEPLAALPATNAVNFLPTWNLSVLHFVLVESPVQ